MLIKKYELNRNCKNPRYKLVLSVQGQNYYSLYHSLFAAVIAYVREICKRDLTGQRYEISLQEWNALMDGVEGVSYG